MKVAAINGAKIQLERASCIVETPQGKSRVTYQRGTPEFDAYLSESESSELIKKMDEIVIGQGDAEHLPKNLLIFGVEGKTGNSVDRINMMAKVFRQYHSGEINAAAVKDTLSAIIADLRDTYAEMGFDPAEFTPQLLRNVYDSARIDNINGASVAAWYDSRPLAAHYNGHSGNTQDWIYYDAKYYYSSEEMKNELQKMISDIGEKYGVSDLELPTTYPKGDIREGLYTSYNTIVNNSARSVAFIGNMIDENMVPPKDFKFFYKGHMSPAIDPVSPDSDAVFDGILHVWYGDWSFTGRVPVGGSVFGPLCVNMYDLIQSKASRIPEEITEALKNFDFHSTVQSWYYTNSHPRRLPRASS